MSYLYKIKIEENKMQEKNKTFFGENGITSTSANHIANVAKEFVENLQKENAAISFLNCDVSLMIKNDSKKTIAFGIKSEMLDKINENLQKITKANSLIAWLREGIKAKEFEMNEIRKMSFVDYFHNEKKIEAPKIPQKDDLDENDKSKKVYHFVEFDDVLAELTVKEREEYYALETKCAMIGKFIHPDGSFSKARNELQERILKPVAVQGEGENAMIYEYFPSVEVKDVEDLFFKLQNEHRETQASLNAIKFKIQQKVDEINDKENARFIADTVEYNNNDKKLNREFDAFKQAKRAELSKLKIIIPKSLEEVFEILNKIGK